MIRAQEISVARGDRILVRDISFEVAPGQLHVITGPNGSGKSTLLAALAGDIPLRDGEISLDGDPLSSLSDLQQAQRRAVLSQRPLLFPYTTRQFLALVEQQRERLGNPGMAHDIDVSDLMDRSMTTLSGGERARVMLEATLSQGTQTLMLDEPTAAFDRDYRGRFMDWLRIWLEANKAIVLVTHDEKIEAVASSVTELA